VTATTKKAFVRVLIRDSLGRILIVANRNSRDWNLPGVTVPSTIAGTLTNLDQLKLGEIVNRTLGGGGNDFEGDFDPTAGIVLGVRIGDVIRLGGTLCRVFTSRAISNATLANIDSCFDITPS